MTKRCAVTGASGYLGGLVVRTLRASGWDVVELGRSGGGATFALGEPVSPAIFAGCDALVHCAYDFRQTKWDDIVRINVDGSARLFEAAQAAGVRQMVLISTISAFDGCKSMYGRAKLMIEAAAQRAHAAVVRPGLVYGPSPGAMFGKLVAQVRASSLLPMPGDGKQLMYTVHEDDLTEAIARALTKSPAPVAPITVANETPIAFRDIILNIGARLDRRVTTAPVPWRLLWLGLRTAELAHIPLGLRSDSMVSLVNQDTAPVLNAERELGVRCRPFDLTAVAL